MNSHFNFHVARCVFPSISPCVRLVPNMMGVASAPEGTVISFSCISVNQVVGVDNATCVGGVWSPDIDGVMCRGMPVSIITINHCLLLLQESVGYLCLLMVWWWLITSLLRLKVLPSTSLVLMV